MITGEMKNKVDSIWDTIWTGGITSPITVLEQITYLMFMKLLDDNQLKAEANANLLGVPLKNKVFQDGMCIISENPRVETEYKNLRWNVFHNFEPGEMLTNMQYVDKYYNLDTWVSLSPVMVKEAKVHISPLLDSGLNGDHLSVAFDVRMYHIEKALLAGTGIKSVSDHVKNIRLIAQYLLTEKASVPQVLKKASELKAVMSEDFWTTATVRDLEENRSSLRDLMQFLGGPHKTFDIDIADEVDEAEYQPEDTIIDIRTYREKVIDYLAEHLDSAVIKKIHNLEPITNADLAELEHILWHELGTKAEYDEATDIGNLAAFVRSLIGLSQEAVNVKFGEYLSGNLLNSQQQEFVRTIINYVRENGDVELADMVNTEPFNNYDLNEIFGVNLPAMIAVVRTLHDVVQVA